MSKGVKPITANITIDVSAEVAAMVEDVTQTVNSAAAFIETYTEGLNLKLAPYGVKATIALSFSMESEDSSNGSSN